MPIFPSFFVNKTGAYEIEQSLRFNGSQKLSRTPSSAGTTTTWTLSYWIKIGDLTAEQAILSANPSAGGYTATWFSAGATSRLKINQYNHPTNVYSKCPTPVYRDPSAWFHVVVVFDSTNATADDRVRFYVNGERQTDFSDDGSSVGGTTNPSQNQASGVNHNAIHYIGSQYDGTYAFAKSYLAEMHLLDGTAVTDAEDFGEYDDNGVWRPIEYTGDSYGTNGFYLKFDETATNGIGHDHSGNGNNWTASGFTTSGTGTDVMNDTPTTNWCTVNPLSQRQYLTTSNGNLQINYNNASNGVSIVGTQGASSGKWYWETTMTTASGADYVGVVTSDWDVMGRAGVAYPGSQNNGWTYYRDGRIYHNGSFSSYGDSYTTGDVIGLALDLNNGKIYFSKNGTFQNSSNPSTEANPAFSNVSGTVFPVWAGYNTSTVHTCNFGQRAFAYTPPTGFKALNTSNLPAPDIADGSEYFNTVLWTGNGSSSSRTISGVGFQPDFTWIKGRSYSGSGNRLMDAVRGAGQMIQTNSQNPEFDDSANVPSFASDGFNLTTNGTSYNASSQTYVAWNWLANGSGSSNTAGSITSTVSVNQTAGFSIVTYSGSTQNDTVGHGLGVAPSLIIFKRRNNTTSWPVYHSAIGPSNFVQLNELSASSSSGTSFGSTPTAPTNTVFSVGNNGGTNYGTMVAYCFAEVEGYSKISSYLGNGSSDGTFVYTGFAPAFLLIGKTSPGAGWNWQLRDSKRPGYNVNNDELRANTSDAELSSSAETIDFLSNGFKPRSANGATNQSGYTYIYLALAENPFGGSGVSPATAR